MSPKKKKQNQAERKWCKLLYVRHDFPDNYVDASFLQSKRTNVNARLYTYWSTVYFSGLIIHQISSVVVFVLIFLNLRQNLVKSYDLIRFCLLPVSFVAYVFRARYNPARLSMTKMKKDLGNLIKFVSFVYGLSPILNSLTETISSDTIYATCTFMLFLNLVSHDYDALDVAVVSKTFSFNAALFAAVCLASRFKSSPFDTFCLISVAFVLFALWPEYRSFLQRKIAYSVLMITIGSVFVCVTMLASLDLRSYLILYLIFCSVVTFVCPAILIKLQRFKNTITGPWDEALIQT